MQVRASQHHAVVSAVLLATVDVVLIAAAFYQLLSKSAASAIAAAHGIPDFSGQLAAGLAAIVVTIMICIGLYRREYFAHPYPLAGRLAAAFVLVVVLVSLSTVAWHRGDNGLADAATLPAKAALAWLACVAITRSTFLITVRRALPRRRIIVLGNGRQAARIAKLTEPGQRPSFLPEFYAAPGQRGRVRCQLIDWEAAEPDILTETGARLGVREIVVASDDRRGLPVRQLLHSRMAGIRVIDFLDFWERETKTVDVDALKPSWLFYSEGFRCGAVDQILKAGFDAVLGFAVLVFLLPLLVLTASLIRLESSGPILYRQERVGRHGRSFTIFKFRSMRADAEHDGRPRWAAAGDPRITRIGAIIRKLHIDELPQILNVLRGEMSFVGPRPERPFFVAELTRTIPYYAERHWVKPGITGWAQVNYPYGASIEDAQHKLSFDLYYVKNHSFLFDILIILKTLRVIFWDHGAR
jgi:sugar transferase (PEP-CTERM system associated)